MNWFRKKVKEVREVLSVKERQRIERGLEYLNDDSVKFGINGVWQKLAYKMDESKEVYDDKVIIHRQYWYYYWDQFFCMWMRACGHGEHFEEAKTKESLVECN